MVEGGGFEPPKAEPADLQSAPFDRSGTPPNNYQLLPISPEGKIGARRGIRTHDLLILTHYYFRSAIIKSQRMAPK